MNGGPLSTPELVVFSGLLILGLVTLPVIIRHVLGTTSVLEEAVTWLASTNHGRARLAGTVHLSWLAVTSAAVAALADGQGVAVITTMAGTVMVLAGVLDLSVCLTGRPRRAVLARHRDKVGRDPPDPLA